MTTNLFTQTPAARDAPYQSLTVLRKKMFYTAGATAVVVGVVPPKAIVVGGGVFVHTATNAGTNNLINVGFAVGAGDAVADPDAFATLLSTAAKGFIAFDELAATTNTKVDTERTITATFAMSGTAATAGEVEIIVLVSTDHEG